MMSCARRIQTKKGSSCKAQFYIADPGKKGFDAALLCKFPWLATASYFGGAESSSSSSCTTIGTLDAFFLCLFARHRQQAPSASIRITAIVPIIIPARAPPDHSILTTRPISSLSLVSRLQILQRSLNTHLGN
jgi:hypothetical protein